MSPRKTKTPKPAAPPIPPGADPTPPPEPAILNLETRLEPINAVQTHPDNPRRGATKAIIESIKTTGFYGTILADRATGLILAGNHRYRAAVLAGLTHVPVTWITPTPEQARRILLADNRISDLGTYDTQELADLLNAVATDDLTGTGYDADDLAELMAHVQATNYLPPAPATPTPLDATPETVETTRERLQDQHAGEKPLHPAMCPHCGHEFYVD